MMFFNKIYSSSTERIVTRSSPTNTFDMELQHPQPRRRQVLDHTHANDPTKDQYYTRAYSIPLGREEFQSSQPDPLSLRNNVVTIPANLPTTVAPDPVIVPPSLEIVEEK